MPVSEGCMRGKSMIWRRERHMCGSIIEQLQRVLSAVVLPHVGRIGNLGPVSILSCSFRGKAHNCLHSREQLLPLPSLQNSEKSPALSQYKETD